MEENKEIPKEKTDGKSEAGGVDIKLKASTKVKIAAKAYEGPTEEWYNPSSQKVTILLGEENVIFPPLGKVAVPEGTYISPNTKLVKVS